MKRLKGIKQLGFELDGKNYTVIYKTFLGLITTVEFYDEENAIVLRPIFQKGNRNKIIHILTKGELHRVKLPHTNSNFFKF